MGVYTGLHGGYRGVYGNYMGVIKGLCGDYMGTRWGCMKIISDYMGII